MLYALRRRPKPEELIMEEENVEIDESIYDIDEDDLPEHVWKLQMDYGVLYIIGTAHISEESAITVKEVINKVQPECVVLELCKNRLSTLSRKAMEEHAKETDGQTINFLIKSIREKKGTVGIFRILLSQMMANFAKEVGVSLGSEFLIAYEEAMKISNCTVILGDRPVDKTLNRIWNSISNFEKVKILCYLGFGSLMNVKITKDDVEDLKNMDIANALAEIGKRVPKIIDILVYERDRYLAAVYQKAVTKRTVAVVGLGHVNGILENIKNKEIDLEELQVIPEPKGLSFKKFMIISLMVSSFLFFGGCYFVYKLFSWMLF